MELHGADVVQVAEEREEATPKLVVPYLFFWGGRGFAGGVDRPCIINNRILPYLPSRIFFFFLVGGIHSRGGFLFGIMSLLKEKLFTPP